MKKIGTITFHSAYNYGSVLQTYALQEFCKKIANEYRSKIEYNVINLRLDIQKELYAKYRKNTNMTNIIRNILTMPYSKKVQQKNDRFEDFINNKIDITKEYISLEDLEKNEINYDYLISGSDQIWNTTAPDFSWAYYLPFANASKKISYAASFGSVGIDEKNKEKIFNLLSNYDSLSVREKEIQELLEKGLNKNVNLNVDPTMLLYKEDWEKLAKKGENKLGKYILLYTLYPKEKVIKLAKRISKKLGLPIVITKFNNQRDYFNNFIKMYNTGPIEFLQLIQNAELVISSSFHGTIFSILFEKPFITIENGKRDLRIETLLHRMKLDNRIASEENIDEVCGKAFDISFDSAKKILEDERKKSKIYLAKALEFED